MILASQSPRRRELLGLISENFSVIPAQIEENIPNGTKLEDTPLLIARQKARRVAVSHLGEMVLGADTIVAIDGVILGKPRDEAHAAAMLRMLSGRFHSVYTGVWIVFEDCREMGFTERTDVEFYPLTEREIADYVATGEPMDKAGAYGIQDRGALLVKRIVGDYYNVMGLPVGQLNHLLRRECVI